MHLFKKQQNQISTIEFRRRKIIRVLCVLFEKYMFELIHENVIPLCFIIFRKDPSLLFKVVKEVLLLKGLYWEDNNY